MSQDTNPPVPGAETNKETPEEQKLRQEIADAQTMEELIASFEKTELKIIPSTTGRKLRVADIVTTLRTTSENIYSIPPELRTRPYINALIKEFSITRRLGLREKALDLLMKL